MTRFRNVPHLVQYVIVGAIGVVISLLLLTSVRNQSRLQAYNRLDRRAEQLAVAVQEGINAKLQVLQAFQAFYAVDGVVDRDEFKKFAVVTLTYHPDIQALQWIPYTPAADREALEARGKLEYGADFGITERNSDGETIPALERDVYFPIFYTERDGAWVLDVDGAIEKSTLDDLRTNHAAVTKERDELKARFDGIDPEQVRTLLAERQKLEDDKSLKAGEIGRAHV